MPVRPLYKYKIIRQLAINDLKSDIFTKQCGLCRYLAKHNRVFSVYLRYTSLIKHLLCAQRPTVSICVINTQL